MQGTRYEEISRLTGKLVRGVYFMLPASSVAALKILTGFGDFYPILEVLHCDKPGTGLKDAPRAFSMKIKTITHCKCGLKPTSFDDERGSPQVGGCAMWGTCCVETWLKTQAPKNINVMLVTLDTSQTP